MACFCKTADSHDWNFVLVPFMHLDDAAYCNYGILCHAAVRTLKGLWATVSGDIANAMLLPPLSTLPPAPMAQILHGQHDHHHHLHQGRAKVPSGFMILTQPRTSVAKVVMIVEA